MTSGVARLLSVTQTLHAPRIFERSVKLSGRDLSTDRGLVSMDRRAIYPGPKSQLRTICGALGCDDPSALDPFLSQCTAVHFGADEDIGKCYLEFVPDNAPENDLVFLALKWREGQQRLNRYVSLTDLTHAEKQAAIADVITDAVVADAMRQCLDLARDGDPDGKAVLLRVTEDRTDRVSLDISVADAGRTLGQVMDVLRPLLEASGEAMEWAEAHADASFGHIAAGMDADSQPFVTIYYGAQAL